MYIIKDSKVKQDVLKKIRFTMDDLIDALRQQGVFDISEVENAIVETNGKISVQQKSECAPLTPKIMDITPPKAEIPNTIVLDGEIIDEYFGECKTLKSEIELILSKKNIKKEEIMMMSITNSGKIYVIKKEQE